MHKFGVWRSGGGWLLGCLNGLAVAEADALDELAEAIGPI
jgi:hypothetical protein